MLASAERDKKCHISVSEGLAGKKKKAIKFSTSAKNKVYSIQLDFKFQLLDLSYLDILYFSLRIRLNKSVIWYCIATECSHADYLGIQYSHLTNTDSTWTNRICD